MGRALLLAAIALAVSIPGFVVASRDGRKRRAYAETPAAAYLRYRSPAWVGVLSLISIFAVLVFMGSLVFVIVLFLGGADW